MIVVALALLILVLLFGVAIVLGNPDVYHLSLFRVLVPVTSPGVFFTGFGAALVTIIALLLLRTGIRRHQQTRRRLRAAGRVRDPEVDRSAAVADAGPDDEVYARRAGRGDPFAPADRPSGSSLDLNPRDDQPRGPVDRATAVDEPDDRDAPRT